jgi:hypothetical protein
MRSQSDRLELQMQRMEELLPKHLAAVGGLVAKVNQQCMRLLGSSCLVTGSPCLTGKQAHGVTAALKGRIDLDKEAVRLLARALEVVQGLQQRGSMRIKAWRCNGGTSQTN